MVMTDPETRTARFFERYAAALQARDEKAVGRLYAVPALILFPGQSIAVADRPRPRRSSRLSCGHHLAESV